MLHTFNPETHTLTQFFHKKVKQVGHYAFARWMLKKGFPFRYTYYICFNKTPGH